MRVIAKSQIKHNGQYFQAGQEVSGLTEPEIAKLVAAKVVDIQDGQVAPEPPVDAEAVKSDKQLENDEQNAVANLPIAITLGKAKLIGIARANGLKVEKTATPSEVYKMIKEYRALNGIEVEAPAKKAKIEPEVAPEGEAEGADAGPEANEADAPAEPEAKPVKSKKK